MKMFVLHAEITHPCSYRNLKDSEILRIQLNSQDICLHYELDENCIALPQSHKIGLCREPLMKSSKSSTMEEKSH